MIDLLLTHRANPTLFFANSFFYSLVQGRERRFIVLFERAQAGPGYRRDLLARISNRG